MMIVDENEFTNRRTPKKKARNPILTLPLIIAQLVPRFRVGSCSSKLVLEISDYSTIPNCNSDM